MSTVAYLIFVWMAFGIVGLSIYDRRRRAKMTPEERKHEDEEIKRETQIW